MAVYPTTESDLTTQAQEIIDGVSLHESLFPSITVANLQGALTGFNAVLTAQRQAKAQAKLLTNQKNDVLEELNKQVKKALRAAESDCINNPEYLSYIGWGTKAPGTPIVAPGAPTNLRSPVEGAGSVTLTWDKPKSGGSVRNYCLYRTTADPESGLANWTLVGFFYDNMITVENQPRGIQLYYMVNASNAGGTSANSNTLPVVL